MEFFLENAAEHAEERTTGGREEEIARVEGEEGGIGELRGEGVYGEEVKEEEEMEGRVEEEEDTGEEGDIFGEEGVGRRPLLVGVEEGGGAWMR